MKEGKIGRKDGQPLPGEDEPLHAYITANNPENVKMAAEKVSNAKKMRTILHAQCKMLMFMYGKCFCVDFLIAGGCFLT